MYKFSFFKYISDSHTDDFSMTVLSIYKYHLRYLFWTSFSNMLQFMLDVRYSNMTSGYLNIAVRYLNIGRTDVLIS